MLIRIRGEINIWQAGLFFWQDVSVSCRDFLYCGVKSLLLYFMFLLRFKTRIKQLPQLNKIFQKKLQQPQY